MRIPPVLSSRARHFRTRFPRRYAAVGVIALAATALWTAAWVFVLAVYLGWIGGPLPTARELAELDNYNASEVYSADGELLGRYFLENRVSAELGELSPVLLDALVATEDARFYEHGGVDFRAMLRVLFRTVLGGDDSGGGGSTLSQQLAKNLYPRRHHLVVSKLREMFIARRLERVYAKVDILNNYLNTVPFSQNIFGVKVAAQRFFGSAPADLRVEEAAVLVGMLKATTAYNPLRNPERSRARRNVVLAQMVKYDYLPAGQLDSLQALPLTLSYYQESNNDGPATYLREVLRGELDDLLSRTTKPDGTPYNLYTDGLRIETTLDAGMQAYAEEAVHTHLIELQQQFLQHHKTTKAYGDEALVNTEVERSARYRRLLAGGADAATIEAVFDTPVQVPLYDWESRTTVVREISPRDSVRYYLSLLNAGFLVVRPDDGAVQAWVGGMAHEYFKYDHVRSRRQVGSTFKPIVYAAALENGMPPCEYHHNRLVTYTEWDGWQPRNSDDDYTGVYSMQGGLMRSINSVTVDVLMQTGIDTVAELATALGVRSAVPAVPAIALGAAEISLEDMVGVYAAFANGGHRVTPHYLRRVTDRQNRTLYEYVPPETDTLVLQPETAQIVTRLLESVVDSGTARRLRHLYKVRGDLAGKTGTTQNQTDGWFTGYTPRLAFGAWVGAEQPAVRWRSLRLGQGAHTALPIAGRFLGLLYADPQYAPYARATFPPLPDSTRLALDCPPRLEYMPEDFFETDGWFNEVEEVFDGLFRPRRLPATERQRRAQQRRQRAEVQRRRNEAIRERNERLKRKRDRQKRRKAFFDDLFGG